MQPYIKYFIIMLKIYKYMSNTEYKGENNS